MNDEQGKIKIIGIFLTIPSLSKSISISPLMAKNLEKCAKIQNFRRYFSIYRNPKYK
jgi:hypothetical protein